VRRVNGDEREETGDSVDIGMCNSIEPAGRIPKDALVAGAQFTVKWWRRARYTRSNLDEET